MTWFNDVLVSKGPEDMSRHVIGCHLIQEARVKYALDDVTGREPGRYYSLRHTMPFDSTSEGATCDG